MNVMNIKHYLSAVAALFMFAACSDYDPGMSNNTVDLTDEEIETIKEFTENFVERYGEMDPNHTWGFGELAEKDEMETRTMEVNSHQWKDPNNGINLDYVPGFPQDVDTSPYSGKYFVEYNTQYYIQKDNAIIGTDRPAGDVTDEEIKYVSAWFRTHKPTTSDEINFNNYFVQAISGDKDRAYYGTMTGEATTNWAEVIDPGQAPSGATKACGAWEESTPKIKEETYKGKTTTSYEGGSETLLYTVDYLDAPKTIDATVADDHVLNFNWQRTNKIDNENPTTTFYSDAENKTGNIRTITYVYDSNTNVFSIFNSNNTITYGRYVIKRLTFDIDGKHYDGYYLAFDYSFYKLLNEYDQDVPESQGGGQKHIKVYAKHDYDGYYSNYIVKIIPGDGMSPNTRPRTISRRVMCEDLGTTYDFDYNDVVFDVVYTRQEEKNASGEWVGVGDGKWTATITLQASGGTLPIYIENFDGSQYNVHEMLGSTLSGDLYPPVNVGTGYTHAPVALPSCKTTSTDPDIISIYVYSKAREAEKLPPLKLPTQPGLQSFGTAIAPLKICVPTSVRWTKEYQQIEWAYPYFGNWVRSENGTAGFGHESDWTLESVDQYLYP